MSARMPLCCVLAALGLLILAQAAMAESRGTEQQRSACMTDAFRFCLSEIPNHKRIEACLRSNRRSLSAACYAEIYDDEPTPPKTGNRVVHGGGHAPE